MWTNELKTKWEDGFQRIVWRDRIKLLGSFILTSLNPSFKPPTKENKVAYLDGLRGFAAFLVYCTHYTAFAHQGDSFLHHSYGFENHYAFATLPIIRNVFQGGQFAVALFFGISGYVLSVSPLNLLSTQRNEEGLRLAINLGCSFPRRFVRLYLPVMATTFLFMTSWHLFNIESSLVFSSGPKGTYPKEIYKWLKEFIQGSYFFVSSSGFRENQYNPHMWSIAAEYRGSSIIYATILAYFALGYGPAARFWANIVLYIYFQLMADGPYFGLFIMGMLLCDVTLTSEIKPHQLPRILQTGLFEKYHWVYYILLTIGLYLGSPPDVNNPDKMGTEPGWGIISHFASPTTTNARWHFAAYSGALCILCIPRIPWLRRMFESSLFQYLGKVSFGFYLVHGPIMWTIGDRLFAAVGRPRNDAQSRIPGWINLFRLPNAGPVGLEVNNLVPHLFILPLTLWIAGVVTKLIDVPSTHVSKRLFAQRTQDQSASGTESEMEAMLPKHNEEVIA